jgi:hypothetical protein
VQGDLERFHFGLAAEMQKTPAETLNRPANAKLARMIHAESGAATVRERKADTEPLPDGRGSSDAVSALSTGTMNHPG